jgi:hypothetical protein
MNRIFVGDESLKFFRFMTDEGLLDCSKFYPVSNTSVPTEWKNRVQRQQTARSNGTRGQTIAKGQVKGQVFTFALLLGSLLAD